jgi:hypothetical protein
MPKKHLNQRPTTGQVASRIWGWIKNDFLGIAREMRWSYLPPLMVYFAAGVAGFTWKTIKWRSQSNFADNYHGNR